MPRLLERRAVEARARGEALLREADKLAFDAFDERLWLLGGPLQPSPTIAHALNAGLSYLDVRCTKCRSTRSIDLSKLRVPGELEAGGFTPLRRVRGPALPAAGGDQADLAFVNSRIRLAGR